MRKQQRRVQRCAYIVAFCTQSRISVVSAYSESADDTRHRARARIDADGVTGNDNNCQTIFAHTCTNTSQKNHTEIRASLPCPPHQLRALPKASRPLRLRLRSRRRRCRRRRRCCLCRRRRRRCPTKCRATRSMSPPLSTSRASGVRCKRTASGATRATSCAK